MQRPLRGGSIALAALALAGLVACAPSAPSRSCAKDGGCPAGSRCTAGSCVANAPPSVALVLPADARTNVLLSFDASSSADQDPGDSVASFAWTFRAVGAPCTPPAVAGTGPIATVRFGCAGRYAVEVAAADRMGASATKAAELDVAANTGPALVTAGADLSRDHACTGAPLRCTTAGAPAALSASALGEAGGVAYAWTVKPPSDRPLSSTRRVTFSPGPDVAQPTVAIETDGDAISGDWIFEVEARDAAGVLGTATQRVSVLNRAPVVVGAPAPVPEHRFDGTRFTASGEVTYTATDPDGDLLLAPAAEHRQTGDGTATFEGTALDGPARVTFSIAVPYAGPGSAGWLIGGADLERTITLAISDVNGAMDLETWPIAVGNRPPALASASGLQIVNHRFDAARASYLADATVGTWSDPDGDPPLLGGGSGSCASFEAAGGSVVVHCSSRYPGAPSLGGIVGQRLVSWHGSDPWTPPGAESAWIEVLNRGPRIAHPSTSVSVSCAQGGCCGKNMDGECIAYYKTLPTGWVSASGVLADDDGDPLNVVVDGAAQAPCVASSCGVSGVIPQKTGCGSASASTTVSVSASDGAASVSGNVTITARCR